MEREKNERWSDHIIHQAPGEVSHLRVYVSAYGWFANMWVVNLQQPQCIAPHSSAFSKTRHQIRFFWRILQTSRVRNKAAAIRSICIALVPASC